MSSCGGCGYYRFYDHVVGAADYDAMEDFTRGFFKHLAAHMARADASPGARFMHELGRWLDAPGPRRVARGDMLPPRRTTVRPGRARRPAGRGLSRPPAPRARWWTSSPTTSIACGSCMATCRRGRAPPPCSSAAACRRTSSRSRRRASTTIRGDARGQPAPGGHPDHDRQRRVRRARRRQRGERVHLVGQGVAGRATT